MKEVFDNCHAEAARKSRALEEPRQFAVLHVAGSTDPAEGRDLLHDEEATGDRAGQSSVHAVLSKVGASAMPESLGRSPLKKSSY